MPIHTLVLLIAILLCGLTTGLVFAFAVVVMPGIRTLPDREFLSAFKAMDRVIQNNNPLFLLVWVGAVVLLIAAGVMNFAVLSGIDRFLLIAAIGLYLGGVQLPTFVANVPLNNWLQSIELAALDASEIQQTRATFETRWNYWNAFRTVFGALATGLLLGVVV